MGIDILIYAVIAALILARLWSVLGRRNEGDGDASQRPNPFAVPNPPRVAGPANPAGAPALFLRQEAPPESLAGGIERIRGIDPAFDEKQFLLGARAAFTQVVADFASGDFTRSKNLLGPKVLPHFEAACAARRTAGQTLESKLLRIREAETLAARLDGAKGLITVRFISEQENTLRDSAGRVVGGAAGKAEEITDIWTFARDLKSGDPNWVLVETKS